MSASNRSGIESTAKIADHPIHPMLIPFPVAFLIGALLTDLAFWRTGSEFWATASTWLIGAGVVGGVLAAIAGLTDFLGNPAIRDVRIAWYHFLGNSAAMVLAIVNLFLRLGQSAPTVPGWGIVLSLIVVAIFAVTGWLGWELVYRHRVGVAGPSETEVRSR